MKLSEGLERLAKESLTMDRDELTMRILGASVQAKELETRFDKARGQAGELVEGIEELVKG